MTNIFYHTALGNAVVSVDGKPLKKLGKFKTEREARAACEAHFVKARRAAENFNRAIPVAHFM